MNGFPQEIKERWPLVNTEDLVGAIYHPTDGYINPADVTMAMAKVPDNLMFQLSENGKLMGTFGMVRIGRLHAQKWKNREEIL